MFEKVKKAIGEYNMISEGDTVLCCLSGGADSVTLLLCLKELGCNIKACHVNHQLRGEESLRDEKFCIDLCAELGIPLEVRRVDVKSFCSENSCSLEEGARKLRYEVFYDIECDKIATAHTLSDSYETALFNLTRGTGLKGLCSIPPVRGKIIRPLIYCTREEVEAFLVQRSQGFVVDSTNLINDCSRNKIRNLVVPVLKEINPYAVDGFGRTVEQLKQDESFLSGLADKLLAESRTSGGYRADILAAAEKPLQNRAIIGILTENDISYSFDRVEEISEIIKNGGKLNLSGDKFALCSRGIFRITDRLDISSKVDCRSIAVNSSCDFFDKTVTLILQDSTDKNGNVHKKFANSFMDYDKIKGEILLRSRQGGDKIRLAGRGHTSLVKKLFNERVPVENRNKTVILADDEGIIFIEGFGAAERVAADDSSEILLICEIS